MQFFQCNLFCYTGDLRGRDRICGRGAVCNLCIMPKSLIGPVSQVLVSTSFCVFFKDVAPTAIFPSSFSRCSSPHLISWIPVPQLLWYGPHHWLTYRRHEDRNCLELGRNNFSSCNEGSELPSENLLLLEAGPLLGKRGWECFMVATVHPLLSGLDRYFSQILTRKLLLFQERKLWK